MDAPIRTATTRLFRPAPAIRMEGSPGSGTVGRNPPNGAILYYSLAAAPEASITLDILDAQGTVVRSYSSEAVDSILTPSGNYAPERLPSKAGLNRFVWDLRHEELPRIPGVFVNGTLQGRRVSPGEYRVRLRVEGREMTEPLTVEANPRFTAQQSEYVAQEQMLAPLDSIARRVQHSAIELRSAREQLQALLGREDAELPDEVRMAGDTLVSRITALEDRLIQTRQETFQDVINFPNQLNSNLLYLKEAIDSAEPMPTGGMRQRLDDLVAMWQQEEAAVDALMRREIAEFNALVARSSVPAVGVVVR